MNARDRSIGCECGLGHQVRNRCCVSLHGGLTNTSSTGIESFRNPKSIEQERALYLAILKTRTIVSEIHRDHIKERFGDNCRILRCDQPSVLTFSTDGQLSDIIGAGVEGAEDPTPTTTSSVPHHSPCRRHPLTLQSRCPNIVN